MMHSYDKTLRAKLLIKLRERSEDLKGELAAGYFCNGKLADHVAMEYRQRVGYLSALHDVERMIDDVAKEMMES